MPEPIPALTSIRHIREAQDVGSLSGGQFVVMNARMEDDTTEWFAIKHSKLGRLIAGLMFGSSVAANDRATVAGQSTQSADTAALIDIVRINASSAPGAGYVALRLVVGEGVNLDFRVPLAVVPALQERIGQAAAVAQGGPTALSKPG